MNLPSSIQLIEYPAGFPVLVVEHPAALARIALNGAHVMEWIPDGHQPVLYMSPDAVLELGKAIRGGIPVCWPWFGPQADPAKPMHGFARTAMWDLDRAREGEGGVEIVLRLRDSDAAHALWPNPFELRLHVVISAYLQVTLQARNTGDIPWTMTGALHTYLNVGDVREISIHGLHGTQFVESRLSAEKRPQHGSVVIDQEVDRLYASDATLIVHDPGRKDPDFAREIVIEKAGSLSTVVWNPWIEKSRRLADLPDDAYPDFLCIEAANAGEDVLTVEPGGEHLLMQRISVRRL
jgi:glucose-6-phosphate 1-epimerase